LHIAVFIENSEGEEVKILDTYISTYDEVEQMEIILKQAHVLENVLKKLVEDKAEGEKSGE